MQNVQEFVLKVLLFSNIPVFCACIHFFTNKDDKKSKGNETKVAAQLKKTMTTTSINQTFEQTNIYTYGLSELNKQNIYLIKNCK